ncbi:MAG TPA: serine/threonine-protein kinase [Gemmatimonadales bacterium]|nr:serine/threonine-protein kinase [Gemmatimonadales bacterium]
MPEPPDSVAHALRDRYTLQRELGRGGMAVVYLAQDVRHNRPVALKLLHPDVAAALGSDRFVREIQLTASLQHPHILPIHDSGEASGRLWYTMPYFAGESLRERLKREPQLPVEDVLHIARNILAALAHAHNHGILGDTRGSSG